MCVVSMVHDYFEPRIPNIWPLTIEPLMPQTIPQAKPVTATAIWSNFNPTLAQQVDELRSLIASFREAVEAAKKVDALTGQPDCVDPEKAKLEARVADLERRIAEHARAAKPARKGRAKQ